MTVALADSSSAEKTPRDSTEEMLFLKDLHQDLATTVLGDPGPDPTWDPGDWPMDDIFVSDD